MTSKRLGALIAIVAALQGGAATMPDLPPGVGRWVSWAIGVLGLGLGAYVAWSERVTLPADNPSGSTGTGSRT